MPHRPLSILITVLLAPAALAVSEGAATLPLPVGTYGQPVHVPYDQGDGLPAEGVARVAVDKAGAVYATTASKASYRLGENGWTPAEGAKGLFPTRPGYDSLDAVGVRPDSVRDVALHDGEVAIAAESGLYLGDGEDWQLGLPVAGTVRWAPVDVRAVAYDRQGRLWFAAPQGVGYRESAEGWKLFTGKEGLPFNDFTCMAAGPESVWFGTTNGAIQYRDGQWHFRQGRRWLLDNHVLDIAVGEDGTAWIATSGGVSAIGNMPMTLAEKADFFESEVEKYHRRTEFGYVNPATLAVPGDKSTAKTRFSDNDGFNTGLYLGAMSFAWATTGEERYRGYAHDAFRALAFLSEVTQGGPYGGPEGLIARNVVPTTEPDPGAVYDKDYDVRRNERDSLWKIMERRVPVDKTGDWYWKTDASSDELDGHFFGAAIYYDRVCSTEEERDRVRVVVRRIMDHLITHNYNLVDYDGKPTRWGRFSPDDLNRDPAWHAERGLNCYSILTYLSIAHHVLGDEKYREEYLKLAYEEGYGMNGMSQPKDVSGPHDPGHQPDDNMAFMNYYHLIRYETDPKLLSMYQFAIREHWEYERLDRNSFSNFVYGACARGKSRTDQWRTTDLSPPASCYEDAVDTLKRYPLDLVEWSMSNAHRIDMTPMAHHGDGPTTMGGDAHGYAYPIDERMESYWDWNYWKLSYKGEGTTLRPPHHYLLAYYMGRYHGFIAD